MSEIKSARKGHSVVPVKMVNGKMYRTGMPKGYDSINAAKKANGLNQVTYSTLPDELPKEGE